MVTRWIVMRHAKTEAEPVHDDRARRLTPAGHAAAQAQGRWLREQGWRPDHVVCSPATRAQQTMQDAIGDDPTTETVAALYGGGVDTYLDALRQAPGNTVMLVAHDPTCTQLVERLAPEAPRKANGKLMPTGAVACFEDGVLQHLRWP